MDLSSLNEEFIAPTAPTGSDGADGVRRRGQVVTLAQGTEDVLTPGGCGDPLEGVAGGQELGVVGRGGVDEPAAAGGGGGKSDGS